jgi:SMI1-KNR4 cell-wall
MYESLIQQIREQMNIKTIDMDDTIKTKKYSPIQLNQVENDEKVLGFKIPELLKRLYLEIGNGSFGPGYGLIGLTGGFPDDTKKIAVSLYLSFSEKDPSDSGWKWPNGLLPICYWGCAIYSCIDCITHDNPMVIFDPNGHEDNKPWTDSFFPESPSFEKWINDWSRGVDLWDEMYKEGGLIYTEFEKRQKSNGN